MLVSEIVLIHGRNGTMLPERAASLQKFRRFAFHSAATGYLQQMPTAHIVERAAFTAKVCS